MKKIINFLPMVGVIVIISCVILSFYLIILNDSFSFFEYDFRKALLGIIFIFILTSLLSALMGAISENEKIQTVYLVVFFIIIIISFINGLYLGLDQPFGNIYPVLSENQNDYWISDRKDNLSDMFWIFFGGALLSLLILVSSSKPSNVDY